jgi:hypothetical protein
MSTMRVKCTIEIDDESFSVETTGPAPESSVVGRAVSGAFAAIAGIDGNMTLSFLLSGTIKAADDAPRVMLAAAQAWEAHNMEPEDTDAWRLTVDSSVWEAEAAKRDFAHLPRKGRVVKR